MKKVVAFSLWGTSDIYQKGAMDAIAQVNLSYPGWEARFYLGEDVPPAVRQELIDRGAVVFEGPRWGPWAGMFWRFLAASDPEVGVMISRDVDTRILPREVEAVNEWLASGRTLHIMRDHPRHEMPIMGGMWGCRTPRLRDMEEMILKWGKCAKYGCDQEFLGRVVYPRFQDDSWIHSECVVFPGEIVHPFLSEPHDNAYVGSALREDGLVNKYNRYLSEWLEAGKPVCHLPYPWTLAGRLRLLKMIIRHKLKPGNP